MSELFIQGRQNNKLSSEFYCANCSVRSTKIFPIFRLFHDNRITMILARNNIIIWCQIDQKPKWTDLSAMQKFGMGQKKKPLNFESEFNFSWGSFQAIKRSIFPRGNKYVAVIKWLTLKETLGGVGHCFAWHVRVSL